MIESKLQINLKDEILNEENLMTISIDSEDETNDLKFSDPNKVVNYIIKQEHLKPKKKKKKKKSKKKKRNAIDDLEEII